MKVFNLMGWILFLKYHFSSLFIFHFYNPLSHSDKTKWSAKSNLQSNYYCWKNCSADLFLKERDFILSLSKLWVLSRGGSGGAGKLAEGPWFSFYILLSSSSSLLLFFAMFWIGCLRGARSAVSAIFEKMTSRDLTTFFSFLTRENLVLFRYS